MPTGRGPQNATACLIAIHFPYNRRPCADVFPDDGGQPILFNIYWAYTGTKNDFLLLGSRARVTIYPQTATACLIAINFPYNRQPCADVFSDDARQHILFPGKGVGLGFSLSDKIGFCFAKPRYRGVCVEGPADFFVVKNMLSQPRVWESV